MKLFLTAAFLLIPALCFAQGTSRVPSHLNSAGMTVESTGSVDLDSLGNPLTAPLGEAIAPVASTVAESCRVFKASSATVYGLSGYVGAATWIMLFNAAAAPADGAVTPVNVAYAAAQGSWSINFGSYPARLTNGAVVCASSTGPLTKTAVATNNIFSGQVK